MDGLWGGGWMDSVADGRWVSALLAGRGTPCPAILPCGGRWVEQTGKQEENLCGVPLCFIWIGHSKELFSASLCGVKGDSKGTHTLSHSHPQKPWFCDKEVCYCCITVYVEGNQTVSNQWRTRQAQEHQNSKKKDGKHPPHTPTLLQNWATSSDKTVPFVCRVPAGLLGHLEGVSELVQEFSFKISAALWASWPIGSGFSTGESGLIQSNPFTPLTDAHTHTTTVAATKSTDQSSNTWLVVLCSSSLRVRSSKNKVFFSFPFQNVWVPLIVLAEARFVFRGQLSQVLSWTTAKLVSVCACLRELFDAFHQERRIRATLEKTVAVSVSFFNKFGVLPHPH